MVMGAVEWHSVEMGAEEWHQAELMSVMMMVMGVEM